MRLGIELSPPFPPLKKAILAELARGLDRRLAAACKVARRRIQGLCDDLIARSPEYQSLLRGDLLGELGLEDPAGKLDAVLRAVRDGVQVWTTRSRVVGDHIEATLEVGILPSDYQALLAMPEAEYVSQPSGQVIPWLKWLTLGGDTIYVYNYHVSTNLSPAERARSRTGLALMEHGGSWRVPQAFVGYPGGNWLTRAFDLGAVGVRLETIFREVLG